ncbi:DUF1007 family protein [Bordetella petrii]|uniref:DUF1007 family protein n=1 Tax=Bordetella petrii TaxID=94624 RepID=UPI001E5F0D98|nr:DUF1007 family protein [Bordetella petrii]MCD0505822.1 DUF1007 family protein [Bordetella petrii]
MWIDARARIVFDAQQRVTAIEQDWKFDEMFGTYTTQGLARNADGSLSDDILKGMARDWMSALGEPISHYFTRAAVDEQTLSFGEPRNAKVSWNAQDQRLTLSFTLPLAQPVAPGQQGLRFDIYDPTYFVAYDFSAPGAVAVSGAPAECAPRYQPPRELDWKTMQQLAAIPADPDALPEELFAITKGLTHRIEVACP